MEYGIPDLIETIVVYVAIVKNESKVKISIKLYLRIIQITQVVRPFYLILNLKLLSQLYIGYGLLYINSPFSSYLFSKFTYL